MKKTYLERQQLINIIYTTIGEGGQPLTRKEIATKIARSKSPYIISVLEDLVHGGYISRQEEPTLGRLATFKYYMNNAQLKKYQEWKTSS